MKLLIVLSALALALATADKISFEGFSVYRVTPVNDKQVQALRELKSSNMGLDFWTDVTHVGKNVDIMVAPHLRFDFQDFIRLGNMESQVFIKNVQEAIDNEQTKEKSDKFAWTAYQTLAEIQDWLKSLVTEHPGKVEVLNAGKSHENRDLLGVKVSFSSANENRGIFIEAGIHAREWITPAIVTWMLNEVLTSTDPNVRAIVERYDWYVFPNYNPDGYVYTHTSNRMWRKTRKQYGLCYGSDPNRNWGYNWMNGGASSNPCSETYGGTSAFSCPENEQMSKFISSVASKLVAYVGFHSYGQLLLLPYGHAGHEYAPNHDQLMTIGNKMGTSLARRYGTQYEVGNIVEVIYVASGGSMDWVKATHPGITLSYTYEVRDTGRYGFLLPPAQIIPCGEETFDSIITMLEEYEAS